MRRRWRIARVDSWNLQTTQELRMRIKYARNFSFFILWLVYVHLLRGKNRYGHVWAVLINPPELSKLEMTHIWQAQVCDCICPCCGPHGARIHTHFGDVTVPVLLLTSFWRGFLFLHRVLLSTVQGQTASPNIITSQNFLLWLLHSWESNCYQNKSTAIRREKICRETPVRNVRYWKRAWFT